MFGLLGPTPFMKRKHFVPQWSGLKKTGFTRSTWLIPGIAVAAVLIPKLLPDVAMMFVYGAWGGLMTLGIFYFLLLKQETSQ